MKRHHSPGAREGREPKAVRIEPRADATNTESSNAGGNAGETKKESMIRVHVDVDSPRKAKRNDPRTEENEIAFQERLRARAKMCPDNAQAPSLESTSAETGVDADDLAVHDSGDNDNDNDSGDDSNADSIHPFPWLENMSATATTSEDTAVSHCTAELIRRDEIRASFWSKLDSQQLPYEATDLAYDLFDRYGRLRPEHCEHPDRRGTGVWGHELDCRDLLLLEDVQTLPAHRRRGHATRVVQALLRKTRDKVPAGEGFTAVVCPGYRMLGRHPLDTERRRQALDTALRFWRSLGFRCVGTSAWLAWTDAAGHPSRQLAGSDDAADRCETEMHETGSADALPDALQALFAKLADPAVDETECVPDLEGTDRWLAVDGDGNTLLHVASLASKPSAVRRILAQGGRRLLSVRNKDGCTPREALEDALERTRTRPDRDAGEYYDDGDKSDHFRGFAWPSVECLAVLRDIRFIDILSLAVEWFQLDLILRAGPPPSDYHGDVRACLRLLFGCTCGQCIGGFLSPRMSEALQAASDLIHDKLADVSGLDRDGPAWVRENDFLLEHVPADVRDNMQTNESLRQGYTALFASFGVCLRFRTRPPLPVESNLRESYRDQWPPVSRTFVRRVERAMHGLEPHAGGPSQAFDCVGNQVFAEAKRMAADDHNMWAGCPEHTGGLQSRAMGADGQPVADEDDEDDEDDVDEWDDVVSLPGKQAVVRVRDLPLCRNDLEYRFVAGMLDYDTALSARERDL